MVFIDDNILIQKWDKNYLLSKNKCFDAVRYCYTVYSSLLFEHYNRILLCDWVPERDSVSLRTCAGHNAFVLHLPLARVGL